MIENVVPFDVERAKKAADTLGIIFSILDYGGRTEIGNHILIERFGSTYAVYLRYETAEYASASWLKRQWMQFRDIYEQLYEVITVFSIAYKDKYDDLPGEVTCFRDGLWVDALVKHANNLRTAREQAIAEKFASIDDEHLFKRG